MNDRAAAAAEVEKNGTEQLRGTSAGHGHCHGPLCQKYATFPPVLPDGADEKKLRDFARTWMTSVWHWAGSAAMGRVVDPLFKVFGFENLHIVDASVLNQLTRMNPSVTVAAMGRYAGQIMNERRHV